MGIPWTQHSSFWFSVIKWLKRWIILNDLVFFIFMTLHWTNKENTELYKFLQWKYRKILSNCNTFHLRHVTWMRFSTFPIFFPPIFPRHFATTLYSRNHWALLFWINSVWHYFWLSMRKKIRLIWSHPLQSQHHRLPELYLELLISNNMCKINIGVLKLEDRNVECHFSKLLYLYMLTWSVPLKGHIFLISLNHLSTFLVQ